MNVAVMDFCQQAKQKKKVSSKRVVEATHNLFLVSDYVDRLLSKPGAMLQIESAMDQCQACLLSPKNKCQLFATCQNLGATWLFCCFLQLFSLCTSKSAEGTLMRWAGFMIVRLASTIKHFHFLREYSFSDTCM